MEDVVIVSGVRTAIGTLGGALSETPASDLGAAVIREAVAGKGPGHGMSDPAWTYAGRPMSLIGG